jgi:hypothetical protein
MCTLMKADAKSESEYQRIVQSTNETVEREHVFWILYISLSNIGCQETAKSWPRIDM